jgi:EAL domain-containing protein (putative c-di-GMP-specific phosphodiesterase class I)
LKIDRTWVTKLLSDPETHAIVEMIVRLAHELKMTVVAEGIEDERQLAELARIGCDTGQGFYLSGPLQAEDAEKLLEVCFTSKDTRGDETTKAAQTSQIS